MKFLIIQENGRHAKNRNYRECFCLQRAIKKTNNFCNVWGLGHSNYNNVPNFNRFDVIINIENYNTKWIPDLSNVKPYKIIWCIDAHFRTMSPYIETFNKDKYNLILQATKDYIDDNSVWFPNCYDATLIKPKSVKKRADVGFCGNIMNRHPYLKLLSEHFDTRTDVMVIGDDMVNAINSYGVHFNKNIANDINYRNFETIGCKIPLATNFNSYYKELGFEDSLNCVIYKNDEEMIEKIKFLLNSESKRNEIANNGYKLAKRHTYDKRAWELMDILKDKM